MNVRQSSIPPQHASRIDQIHRALFRNKLSAKQDAKRIISNSPPTTQFHPLRPNSGGLLRKSLIVHCVGRRIEPCFGYTKTLIEALVGGSDVKESMYAREQPSKRQPLQRAFPYRRRREIV